MLYAVRSHTGLVRQDNQDTIKIDPELGIFIVADGMGGHSCGKEASNMAAEAIHSYLTWYCSDQSSDLSDPEGLSQAMRKALATAHRSILDFAKDSKISEPMGTTSTVLWKLGGKGVIGHIGDTRLYRKTQGQDICLVTTAHTVAQELVDMGRLSSEAAARSQYANVLTQVLGVENKFGPDIEVLDLQKEECFLLCSDGLSSLVDEEQISSIMDSGQTLEEQADAMLGLALDKGAHDNVSVILIQLDT